MSALGEYIHYYKRNYFSYGINRTKGKRGDSTIKLDAMLSDKRREIAKAFQIREDKKFKKRYQTALNYLYGQGPHFPKDKLKEREESIYKQFFYKTVQEEFPDIIIDHASLSATFGLDKVGNLKRINTKSGTGNKKVSFGTLERRIQQIEQLLDPKEGVRAQYPEEKLAEKEQLFTNVKQQIQDIYMQLTKTGATIGSGYVQMKHYDQTKGFGIDLTNMNQEQETLLKDLNELISFFNGTSKAEIHGRLGELSAAIAGAKMAHVGAAQLKEYIESVIVGRHSSSPSYLKVNFSDELVDMSKLATRGWSYNEEDGNVILSTPTQDKVDVQIQTKEGMKYLSVKNYNLRGGSAQLSLVSGMSLLTLLQDENESDFVNHYLNITSSREEEKAETVAILTDWRAQMHDIVKEIILAKALTGLNIQKTMKTGETKTSVADFFVVNDNSRPGFYKVLSMSDLLDFSSLNNKTGLSKYATINGYDDPVWDNEGTSARARITDLMMQMHQKKLYAFASSKVLLQ